MSDEHVTLPDEEPPGDEHGDATGEATSPPPGPVCAECGNHVEPEQQYCLECGAPTPVAVPLRSRGSTPGLVAAALLALAVGGASLIYAVTREDGTTTVASVPTEPTVPTYPTFPTGTNPFPTSTVPTYPTYPTVPTTATTTAPTTPGPPTGQNYDEIDDWPYPDETRWTVIMASAEDVLDAQDYCDTLRSRNFTCGILNSSFYSSLNPGYYAVFHGTYTSKAAADQALASFRSTYPTAYVRKVEV